MQAETFWRFTNPSPLAALTSVGLFGMIQQAAQARGMVLADWMTSKRHLLLPALETLLNEARRLDTRERAAALGLRSLGAAPQAPPPAGAPVFSVEGQTFSVEPQMAPGHLLLLHSISGLTPYLITGGGGQQAPSSRGMIPLTETRAREWTATGWGPERKETHRLETGRRLMGAELGWQPWALWFPDQSPEEVLPELRDTYARHLREAQAAKTAQETEEADETRSIGPWFEKIEKELAPTGSYSLPDTVVAKVLRAWFTGHGVPVSIKVRRYSMASGLDFGPKDPRSYGGAGFTSEQKARLAQLTAHLPPDTSGILDHNRTGSGDFRVHNAYVGELKRLLVEEMMRLDKPLSEAGYAIARQAKEHAGRGSVTPGARTSGRAPGLGMVGYLTLDSHTGPEALRMASAELAAAGMEVSAQDLQAALYQMGAQPHGVTGETPIPGAHPPTFPYDDMQDMIRRAGVTREAFPAAWLRVKGHLRLQWATGDHSKPSDAQVLAWAGVTPAVQDVSAQVEAEAQADAPELEEVPDSQANLILHFSPEEGLVIRGNTRPYAPAIKALKDLGEGYYFKWSGSMGAWYRPKSRGLSNSPIDLARVTQELADAGATVALDVKEALAAPPAPAPGRGPDGLYRYGVPNRPIGYATVPPGYMAGATDPKQPEATRHGTVAYSDPLSPEAVKQWQLVPLWGAKDASDAIAAKMAKYADKYRKMPFSQFAQGVGQQLERLGVSVPADREALAAIVLAKLGGPLSDEDEDEEPAPAAPTALAALPDHEAGDDYWTVPRKRAQVVELVKQAQAQGQPLEVPAGNRMVQELLDTHELVIDGGRLQAGGAEPGWAHPSEVASAARGAFEGTSQFPEQRALSAGREYASTFNDWAQGVRTHMPVDAPEDVAWAEETIAGAKQRFLSAFTTWLRTHAGTTSWLVTGPSGRNERREQKKHASADRRYQEAQEVLGHASERIRKELHERAIERAGGHAAIAERRAEQAVSRGAYAVRARQVAERAAELAQREATQGQEAQEVPFPAGERQVAYGQPPTMVPGGTVEYDYADDRLRIRFDERASSSVAYALKHGGWKWSPRNTAWQRQLTDNAVKSAGGLVGLRPGAPSPEGLPYLAGRQEAVQAASDVAAAQAHATREARKGAAREGEGSFLDVLDAEMRRGSRWKLEGPVGSPMAGKMVSPTVHNAGRGSWALRYKTDETMKSHFGGGGQIPAGRKWVVGVLIRDGIAHLSLYPNPYYPGEDVAQSREVAASMPPTAADVPAVLAGITDMLQSQGFQGAYMDSRHGNPDGGGGWE